MDFGINAMVNEQKKQIAEAQKRAEVALEMEVKKMALLERLCSALEGIESCLKDSKAK